MQSIENLKLVLLTGAIVLALAIPNSHRAADAGGDGPVCAAICI